MQAQTDAFALPGPFRISELETEAADDSCRFLSDRLA